MVRYFLSALTTPEQDLWVNLSPYEQHRIVPEAFGQTEMGRDLLAQDYLLKQITASLMYPEEELGKVFWRKIYQVAAKQGIKDLPINTLNKVWIVPDKAKVYEHGNTAYIVNSRLKVMLEEDYQAQKKLGTATDFIKQNSDNKSVAVSNLSKQIIREIIIPELEKEVNEGKNFAPLRQVYSSLILSLWFKKRMKQTLLGQKYADKRKVEGIRLTNNILYKAEEKEIQPEQIYEQYLQAFKKGVYNFIKEEQDPITKERIPHKYFAGGFTVGDFAMQGGGLEFTRELAKALWPDAADLFVSEIDLAPDDPFESDIADKVSSLRIKYENDIREIVNKASFKKIGSGTNDFVDVYEVTDPQSPLFGYVIKVPYGYIREDSLNFAKSNMGGLIASFNTVSNVYINGVMHKFVVIQKKLKVFDQANRLADVKYKNFDLGKLEKDLILLMIKRGIYFSDALMSYNYGFDEAEGKLYLIDFGDAEFVSRQDSKFTQDVFYSLESPQFKSRGGNYKWGSFLDVSGGRYFDQIGLPDNDQLYQIWGKREEDNKSVEDIQIAIPIIKDSAMASDAQLEQKKERLRAVKYVTMDGVVTEEVDQMAQTLLEDPNLIQLLEFVPLDSDIKAGSSALVFIKPQSQTVTRLGFKQHQRPAIDSLLQPINNGKGFTKIGKWIVEVLPRIEQFGLTAEELDDLKLRILNQGYELWDLSEDNPQNDTNIGKTSEGKPVIIDGGAVRKLNETDSIFQLKVQVALNIIKRAYPNITDAKKLLVNAIGREHDVQSHLGGDYKIAFGEFFYGLCVKANYDPMQDHNAAYLFLNGVLAGLETADRAMSSDSRVNINRTTSLTTEIGRNKIFDEYLIEFFLKEIKEKRFSDNPSLIEIGLGITSLGNVPSPTFYEWAERWKFLKENGDVSNFSLLGVDNDPLVISTNRRYLDGNPNKHLGIVQGGVQDLIGTNGAYQIIRAFNVLRHYEFPEVKAILERIALLLSDGGYFIQGEGEKVFVYKKVQGKLKLIKLILDARFSDSIPGADGVGKVINSVRVIELENIDSAMATVLVEQVNQIATEAYRVSDGKVADTDDPIWACGSCGSVVPQMVNLLQAYFPESTIRNIEFKGDVKNNEVNFHQFIIMEFEGEWYVIDPTWQQFLSKDKWDRDKRVFIAPLRGALVKLRELGVDENKLHYWAKGIENDKVFYNQNLRLTAGYEDFKVDEMMGVQGLGPGGIDLTDKRMNLEVDKDRAQISQPMDLKALENIEINALYIKNIKIKPISDLPALLGVSS